MTHSDAQCRKMAGFISGPVSHHPRNGEKNMSDVSDVGGGGGPSSIVTPRKRGIEVNGDESSHLGSPTPIVGPQKSGVDETSESGVTSVKVVKSGFDAQSTSCLLYTSPSPRDLSTSRMPSSA